MHISGSYHVVTNFWDNRSEGHTETSLQPEIPAHVMPPWSQGTWTGVSTVTQGGAVLVGLL